MLIVFFVCLLLPAVALSAVTPPGASRALNHCCHFVKLEELLKEVLLKNKIKVMPRVSSLIYLKRIISNGFSLFCVQCIISQFSFSHNTAVLLRRSDTLLSSFTLAPTLNWSRSSSPRLVTAKVA